MSNDFKKILVKDPRLMVTDSLNYAVCKGGQNVTHVRMPAISATPNALNFVIPFPSESTVLDREVFLNTQTDYYITFGSAISGVPFYLSAPVANVAVATGYNCPLVLGYNISPASFPSQRTMETIQVQINNNIDTINSSDVLPALLRCSDAIEWERYNLSTASIDRFQDNISETLSINNNNMGSYDLVQGNKSIPNGSNPNILYALNATTPRNSDGSPNFLFNGLSPNQYGYTSAGTKYFLLRVSSIEPLIAPPFIWNKTLNNKQGIYGIQNLQIVCNYKGNLNKALKISDFAGLANGNGVQGSNGRPIWVSGFSQPTITQVVNTAELQMKYITPHTTDIMPARNVCPLLQYPRFITSNVGTISNAYSSAWNSSDNNHQYINISTYAFINGMTNQITGDSLGTNPPSSISVPSATIQSQTFTLNMIPDKLIIFVRPGGDYQSTSLMNDWVFPITNISIQWNNHAGILANASQAQLFHMSQEAGSNQDWNSFIGVTNTIYNRYSAMVGNSYQPNAVQTGLGTSALPGYAAIAQNYQTATIGSYLMLDLAKHLEITEPYFSPGSLGSFQLQITLTIQNYCTRNIGTSTISPEIVIIPVNSGILVNQHGQTSSYLGILTKSDVLDASLQEPLSELDVTRLIGGRHHSGNVLPKSVMPGVSRKNMEISSHSMSKRLM